MVEVLKRVEDEGKTWPFDLFKVTDLSKGGFRFLDINDFEVDDDDEWPAEWPASAGGALEENLAELEEGMSAVEVTSSDDFSKDSLQPGQDEGCTGDR
ncbi:hypothetical protein DPEC_G00319110 [Dallia pectoralis]|uniref:Uncharacterized protein n=1 Tax=Dallia pectoralis TaxID=75939 RepID=A0ACC2F9F3_DALPE|nr:hypothetical protein DPEC_G00319110 [Dallia pectoralis]